MPFYIFFGEGIPGLEVRRLEGSSYLFVANVDSDSMQGPEDVGCSESAVLGIFWVTLVVLRSPQDCVPGEVQGPGNARIGIWVRGLIELAYCLGGSLFYLLASN